MAVPTSNNPQQVVSPGGGTTVTVAGYTPTAGATSNSFLVAFASATHNITGSEATDTVTYAGNAMTEIVGSVAHNSSGPAVYGSFWVLANPLNVAASGDVVATSVGVNNGRALTVRTILGANIPADLQDLVAAFEAADVVSPYDASITTAEDESHVVSGIHIHNNAAFAPNTVGLTEDTDDGGANVAQATGQIDVAIAGLQSVSWTNSVSEQSAHSLIAFGPVASDVTVTPGAVSTVAARTGPQVVLGSMSIPPGAAPVVGAVGNPAVVQSSVAPAPGLASAVAAARDPSVGALVIAPALGGATAAVVAPGVVLGSLALTPAPRTLHATTEQPSVAINGGAMITPAPSSAAAATRTPSGAVGDSGVTFGMDFPIAGGTTFPVLEQPGYIGGGFR